MNAWTLRTRNDCDGRAGTLVSLHRNRGADRVSMTIHSTAYRWPLWAAVVAWAIPLVAIGCAQFVRGTYVSGEYLNPRDYLGIYATVAGWCMAVVAFAGALVIRSKMQPRYAFWSLMLSGVYALAPLLFLGYWLLSIVLRKFPL